MKSYRLASEHAADDAVLAATPDAPAYAELLVACSRVRASLPPALCAMASPSTIGRRVELILDESTDRRASCILGSAFLGVVAALVATGTMLFTPALASAPPSASK